MLGAAFLYYVVRFVIFAVIIGAGIFAGMKIRKNKDQKNS